MNLTNFKYVKRRTSRKFRDKMDNKAEIIEYYKDNKGNPTKKPKKWYAPFVKDEKSGAFILDERGNPIHKRPFRVDEEKIVYYLDKNGDWIGENPSKEILEERDMWRRGTGY